MTELQILRASLFDEIARIKRGDADLEETKVIVSVSNSIIQSYNTEVKAVDTLIRGQQSGAEVNEIVNVFKNNEKMKEINYEYSK